MKATEKHFGELKKKIAEHAKAKKEYVAFFKKGGSLEEFKPKYKHVARPF